MDTKCYNPAPVELTRAEWTADMRRVVNATIRMGGRASLDMLTARVMRSRRPRAAGSTVDLAISQCVTVGLITRDAMGILSATPRALGWHVSGECAPTWMLCRTSMPWSAEEAEILSAGWHAGESMASIARRLGRGAKFVRCRRIEMGLGPSESRDEVFRARSQRTQDANRERKRIANRKRAEANRKRAEANRKRKAEAERKRKAEAERKRKAEAERPKPTVRARKTSRRAAEIARREWVAPDRRASKAWLELENGATLETAARVAGYESVDSMREPVNMYGQMVCGRTIDEITKGTT